MAAIVLGALTQATDRTPWLAAILADRLRAPGLAIAAAAIALAGNYTIGVIGGLMIAPLLTPEARTLLLALALVLAGAGTAFSDKSPDRLEGWRVGRGVTVFAGLAIMVFGDRMQFIVAALAARSPLPWAAAVGATMGALGVTTAAVVLGERQWLALPQRWLRIGVAGVLVVAGVVIGLSAVSLI